MAARAGFDHIINKLDGIRSAGIFRQRIVFIIWIAGLLIQDDIFVDSTEADRIPDLRLIFLREIDAFSIAAALEVEDAIIAPAVFVVADQAAAGIGRETGLAST